MLRQIRKYRVRAFAAGAALLFAGAVSPLQAGSIDVRVTPEMRVVKTSPQPKTTRVNARWSNRTTTSKSANASNSLRVVHYPTVVLGTATHIQPNSAIIGTSTPQNMIASGELLPMTLSGVTVGVTADGTVVSSSAVTDAATVGVVATPLGSRTAPVNVVRSDFIGIAGPGGSPFGVAGPVFLSNGTIVRPVVNRSTTSSGVTSGVTTGVGTGSNANLVIGNGTMGGISGGSGGASGNLVIGVGGAALSGGSGR